MADSARAFECVFVSSPLLDELPPDPTPFLEYFSPGCSVVTFESLGKDAWLVAPCPGVQGSNFSHLARFVSTASPEQISAFWQCVGESIERRLNLRPRLSTAASASLAAFASTRVPSTIVCIRSTRYNSLYCSSEPRLSHLAQLDHNGKRGCL
jgi:hypothetical protein